MVDLQLREEKTGRWLPGKKLGAGTKLRAGKKPGAGKTGASSSTPKKRAAPPQLRGGNASRKPNKGKEKATEEVTSPSLHKKGKEKEVTSSSMATEKVILLNKMSYFSENQSRNNPSQIAKCLNNIACRCLRIQS